MKNLLLSLFLLSCFILNAQKSKVQHKMIDSIMTVHHKPEGSFEEHYFDLPMVKESKHPMHIRFSWRGVIVDIVRQDTASISGTLTQYATARRASKATKKDFWRPLEPWKVYYQITALTSKQCKSLAGSILQSQQHHLKQRYWANNLSNIYFECPTIKFQCMIDAKYIEQKFDCPWTLADSSKAKAIVLSNYTLISDFLSLQVKDSSFTEQLPKGESYFKDGIHFIYKKTDREKRVWKKSEPRRLYLKSISDRVDNYLEREFSAFQITGEEVICKLYFVISFNTNGKLCRIKIDKFYNDWMDGEIGNLKERRTCKKLIRDACKHINLAQFELAYPLERVITVNKKGKLSFFDDTIY